MHAAPGAKFPVSTLGPIGTRNRGTSATAEPHWALPRPQLAAANLATSRTGRAFDNRPWSGSFGVVGHSGLSKARTDPGGGPAFARLESMNV